MKKTTIVSDLSGKELSDHIHVSIEKPGMMIEYPDGHFTNRLELDLDESELSSLMPKIKYKPDVSAVHSAREVTLDATRLS